MARDGSTNDLAARIANSEPAALRIGEAMRLFPMILLRHDPRVQRAYEVWRQRVAQYEDIGAFTEAAALRCLYEDSVQLNALVRELRLTPYHRWLPQMIRWEYQRALENAPQVLVTVPEGLAWASCGKQPKQRPGAMGGFRLEDLERTITLFVRSEVSGEPKKRIATACGITARDVRHHVRRARTSSIAFPDPHVISPRDNRHTLSDTGVPCPSRSPTLTNCHRSVTSSTSQPPTKANGR